MELISVIIPTYNRKKKLVKAIKSVQNQTYKHVEILVCDDGSTDNTKEIVGKILKIDKRVKFFSGRHFGLPAVQRNKGINKAKGGWIALLDDDDEWFPGKLENQLKFVKKTKYSLICCNAVKINNKKEKIGNFFPPNNQKSIKFSTLLRTNPIINSSVFLKKKDLIRVGLFDESEGLKAVEDYDLWLRMAGKYRLGYQDKVLIKYSDDPKNSIRKNFSSHDEIFRVIYASYIKWCNENNFYNFKYLATYIKLKNIERIN